MKKENLTIVGCILALVAVIFILIVPSYDEIAAIKELLDQKKAEAKDLRDFNEEIKKLLEEYNVKPEEFEKKLAILPKEQEIPVLLRKLETMAASNSLLMTSVDFRDLGKKVRPPQAINESTDEASLPKINTSNLFGQKQEAEPQEPYKTMSVNLRLTGNYENFKTYLRSIEESDRMMDVVSMGVGGGIGEINLSFALEVYVYYQ